MTKEEHIHELDRIMSSIGRHFTNARKGFHRFPVSGPEFFVLRRLAFDGPARITLLAAEFGLDQSTVSNIVNGLYERDLVTKDKDPDDRRVTLVGVSSKARELIEHMERQRFERIKQLFGHLSEEDLSELVRIVTKLREGLENSDRMELS